jgi:hypothetical protein
MGRLGCIRELRPPSGVRVARPRAQHRPGRASDKRLRHEDSIALFGYTPQKYQCIEFLSQSESLRPLKQFPVRIRGLQNCGASTCMGTTMAQPLVACATPPPCRDGRATRFYRESLEDRCF